MESENHYTCCTMDWSTDEDDRKTSYIYDDMNRVKRVYTEISGQSESSPLVEYSYDAFGNQYSVMTRSDASTERETIYTYDKNNRVTKIVYPTGEGGASLLDDEYLRYDDAGNLCGSGIADQGGLTFSRDNAGNPLTWGDIAGAYGRVYTYDKNNRLDSVNYPGAGLVDFTYDWVGNRVIPGGFGYNAADQLTSANGHTYGYDEAGNQTTVDGVTRYTYTPDNLLSTAGESSMVWDGAGNRVSWSPSPVERLTFVYDPTAGIPAVLEEWNDSVLGLSPAYYIREPGGALIACAHMTLVPPFNWTYQYYHFDDLGSTLFLTGGDGTVTDSYTYDGWGNVTSHTGSTSQPYQYVGELGYYTHDQDPDMAGLLQLGVRFYEPGVGRFTQMDPIGEGLAGREAYEYVGNDPVDDTDPLGLYRHKRGGAVASA